MAAEASLFLLFVCLCSASREFASVWFDKILGCWCFVLLTGLLNLLFIPDFCVGPAEANRFSPARLQTQVTGLRKRLRSIWF